MSTQPLDLDELSALISPISHLRMEGGNVTLGADGLGGLLEWFSPGEDRPDVMMGVAAACNAAPQLIARVCALEAALGQACDLIDKGYAYCSDCECGSTADEWRHLLPAVPSNEEPTP